MYALDIHSNSFFPLFVLLYVLQVRSAVRVIRVGNVMLSDKLSMSFLPMQSGFDWERRPAKQGQQEAL